MAITSPGQNTEYCEGTSGAKIEWQTPDRTVEIEEGESAEDYYEWDGQEFTQAQLPIKYATSDAVGALVETILISPGTSETTTATLALNTYYTFVVTGTITLTVSTFADGCFFVDSGAGTQEPSDRLTTDDEQFENMFFNAADTGAVTYDPILHQYSVGFIGNDSTVTFSLASGGTGTLQIEIYENEYTITVSQPAEDPADPDITLFTETRDKPYLNINIACGGDCPTRTSFACECNGDRSCYYDDDAGNITKVFEGSENP